MKTQNKIERTPARAPLTRVRYVKGLAIKTGTKLLCTDGAVRGPTSLTSHPRHQTVAKAAIVYLGMYITGHAVKVKLRSNTYVWTFCQDEQHNDVLPRWGDNMDVKKRSEWLALAFKR